MDVIESFSTPVKHGAYKQAEGDLQTRRLQTPRKTRTKEAVFKVVSPKVNVRKPSIRIKNRIKPLVDLAQVSSARFVQAKADVWIGWSIDFD